MSDDRPGFFAANPGCGCMACEYDRSLRRRCYQRPTEQQLDALVEATKQPRQFMVSEKDRHALNADRITQSLEQIGIPVVDQPEKGAGLPGFKTTQYHGIEIVWDEYMGCDYGCLPDRRRPWWHWRRLWNMRPWNKE